MLLMFVVESRCRLKGGFGWFSARPVYLRWGAYVLGTLAVLTYGVYGGEEQSFIYFQF